MAGDGNYLWRHSLPGAEIVLKVYYGNRSSLLYAKKTFGNVVLTGRTSHMPKARCAVEADCVRTWQSHGFRCFDIYPQVDVDGLPREGYMAFEYVPGKHFKDLFIDRSLPLEERMAIWRQFIPEWHRRHRIAVDTSDSRLIHENGDVKHVMLYEGGFVYFDFEMIYRSKDVRMLVGREICSYMRSVGRFFGPRLYERMLDDLVAHYPDSSLLLSAWDQAYRHNNPFMRFARWLDRMKPSNKKIYSKYRVAEDIASRLSKSSLTTG